MLWHFTRCPRSDFTRGFPLIFALVHLTLKKRAEGQGQGPWNHVHSIPHPRKCITGHFICLSGFISSNVMTFYKFSCICRYSWNSWAIYSNKGISPILKTNRSFGTKHFCLRFHRLFIKTLIFFRHTYSMNSYVYDWRNISFRIDCCQTNSYLFFSWSNSVGCWIWKVSCKQALYNNIKQIKQAPYNNIKYHHFFFSNACSFLNNGLRA